MGVRRKLLDFRFAIVIMLPVFFTTTWIDFCRIESIEIRLSKMESAQSVNNKVIKIKSQAQLWCKRIRVIHKKRVDEKRVKTE